MIIFPYIKQDMTGLLYLYLTDNHIDYIPVPLPDTLRSLHLQVYLLAKPKNPSIHPSILFSNSAVLTRCFCILTLFMLLLFISSNIYLILGPDPSVV